MIMKALKKNPNDTISIFYLAQSYRDANVVDKAIEKARKARYKDEQIQMIEEKKKLEELKKQKEQLKKKQGKQ